MNPALEGNTPKMRRAAAGNKPGFIHIPAFMAESSAINAFSLGWSSTPAA